MPSSYRDLYTAAAATCPGMSAEVLMGIGAIESSHGANPGPSTAGAVGPMQFMADAWEEYGFDANGDGRADPLDPADAIHSAARMLCANGGGDPETLPEAVARYNPGDPSYAAGVLAAAAAYARGELARSIVLDNPRIALHGPARADVSAGVDDRLVTLLGALAEIHPIEIKTVVTGHSVLVAGKLEISNHIGGRAADISAVAGMPVGSGNEAARQLVAAIAGLPANIRPDEVGSPFPEFERLPGFFSDTDHRGHIHVGFDPKS